MSILTTARHHVSRRSVLVLGSVVSANDISQGSNGVEPRPPLYPNRAEGETQPCLQPGSIWALVFRVRSHDYLVRAGGHGC